MMLGYGAFGRLAASSIARHARSGVEVVDVQRKPNEALPPNAKLVDPMDQLAAVERAQLVVLAVPVQQIEPACREIAPHLVPGAIVADVASVKLAPLDAMHRCLPAHARVLGTHPLFGPQTALEKDGSIVGEPVALCTHPDRPDPDLVADARSFLETGLGLRVLEMTADEHDRQMADIQVITHLVSHAARDLDLPDYPAATRAYQRLRQMTLNTASDSDELFDAIQRLNPHAADARDRFLAAVTRIVERGGGS